MLHFRVGLVFVVVRKNRPVLRCSEHTSVRIVVPEQGSLCVSVYSTVPQGGGAA